MKKTIFEEMGGTYIRHGNYLFPVLFCLMGLAYGSERAPVELMVRTDRAGRREKAFALSQSA